MLLSRRFGDLNVHGAEGIGRGLGPSLTHGGRNVVRWPELLLPPESVPLPAGIAFVNTLKEDLVFIIVFN